MHWNIRNRTYRISSIHAAAIILRRVAVILVVFLFLVFIIKGQLVFYMGPQGEHNIKHTCPNVSFSRTNLSLTALASYPGSGNTWLRHLLQKLTGIATGAVYSDPSLRRNGFPGEGIRDGSVVAIKTHYKYSHPSPYDKVILLVRNPYEALLSEFRRRLSDGESHTGSPTIDTFLRFWNSFVHIELNQYRSFYLSWFQHNHVLPVTYDKLKTDLSHELAKILSFLNVSGDIQCALDDTEGNFHRPHTKNMPLEFFYSDANINTMNRFILELKFLFSVRFKDESFNMKDWLM